jgi:hypothetical protein
MMKVRGNEQFKSLVADKESSTKVSQLTILNELGNEVSDLIAVNYIRQYLCAKAES